GETEALGEEALAELDHAPPAHGEEIVVEEDVAHAEPLEATAHLDHVVDAVETAAPARRRAVAEGAREGAATRRHHARHRRGAVVEDVRLEAEREVRHQVPRRLGQAIERLAVPLLGARPARPASPCASRRRCGPGGPARARPPRASACRWPGSPPRPRAPGRAGGPSTRRAARRRPRSWAAWRAYSGMGAGGERA